LQVEDVVDLKAINGENALLGWCRGLMALDDGKFWVGFTRVRKTKFRDNILWVRSIFHDGMPEKPTHMAIYDLASRKCLQEFDLEAHGMNVVFSIFPAVTTPLEIEQLVAPSAEIAQRR